MDSANLNRVKNSKGANAKKNSHAGGASAKKLRSQDAPKAGADEKAFHFLKQHARGLLALVVMILLVHDVFGTHGFLAMRRTEREIKRVQADLDHLNKENEDLEQQVQDLKTDPRTIERLAREGSLLARPGEVIIKIPQSHWTESSAKTKP
jgi:cell division protein FtsB